MTDTNASEANITDTCGTFNSTGFHLETLDWIKTTIQNMTRMYVADPKNAQPFPTSFKCAHCDAFHVLTHELISAALFSYPGIVDMVAMYNELQAMIHKTHPTDVGNGSGNGYSVSTDTSLSDIVSGAHTEEEETLSGTDSANIATVGDNGAAEGKSSK